jgi:hypothetical protein
MESRVSSRHRVSSYLRYAASRPAIAAGVIALADLSGPLTSKLARLTRANAKPAEHFRV